MTKKNAAALAAFILLSLAVEVGASLLTFASVREWYPALLKPSWTPPDWLFGPVWTFLYISMAVAAWLVWLRRGKVSIRPAMTAYFIQLALNFFWSGIFFGMNLIGLALIEIVLLWIMIVVTLIQFWKIRPAAGMLLIPYLAWVSYATALNFAIWRLNG